MGRIRVRSTPKIILLVIWCRMPGHQLQRIDGTDRSPEHGGSRAASDVKSLAMVVQEGIRHADKPTIRLTGLCSNYGFEFRHVANRSYDHLHSGGQSSGFEGFQEKVSDVWRRHWIEQDGGTSDAWRNLFEQLQTTCQAMWAQYW